MEKNQANDSTPFSDERLPFELSGRATKQVLEVPQLGTGDVLGAGDSFLVRNLLPDDLSQYAFERMRSEVKWQTMYHRGGEVPRMVAVQGDVGGDGRLQPANFILQRNSFPVYRHPADESPPLSAFSPTVALIREHVQKAIKHPVNHVLIQYYRSGKDYISEHSDKTIDVVRGSNIVNVSLGAQRIMTLRLKRDKLFGATSSTIANAMSGADEMPLRPAQRIPLPHNSMFVLGPTTNAQWLHGIKHDNRPLANKSEAERYEGGGRISLTFRHIGTFLSQDEKLIWGQGAKGKNKEEARPVVNGTDEAAKLIRAFGEENQRPDFDWEAVYGMGFDVLHFKDGDSGDKSI